MPGWVRGGGGERKTLVLSARVPVPSVSLSNRTASLSTGPATPIGRPIETETKGNVPKHVWIRGCAARPRTTGRDMPAPAYARCVSTTAKHARGWRWKEGGEPMDARRGGGGRTGTWETKIRSKERKKKKKEQPFWRKKEHTHAWIASQDVAKGRTKTCTCTCDRRIEEGSIGTGRERKGDATRKERCVPPRRRRSSQRG